MKNINYTRFGRKFIITLVVLLVVAGGYEIIFDLINRFIVEYITGNIEYNIFVKLLFIPVALVILFYQARLIYNRYKPSFNQVMVFILLMGLFVIARFVEVKWEWVATVEKSSVAGKWYSFVSGLILLDVVWLFCLFPVTLIYRYSFPVIIGVLKYLTVVFRRLVGRSLFKGMSNLLSKAKRIVQKGKSVLLDIRKEIIVVYNDILTRLLSYRVFRYLRSLRRKKEEPFFAHDKPIESGRGKYFNISNKIVKKLLEANYDSAFSIGIVGPYGNGKTSLLNHFSERIGEKAEVIEFYPSFSSRPEMIVDDYFSLLAHKLKKYDGRMNQIMVEYIAKLLELSINKSRNIQGLLKSDNRMFKGRPAHSLYQELKSIFEKLPKKVFVFIDDVDRLGRDEILEMFKIIRNTSDLPNIIFVVAFDKDYVVKTIDKDASYINKYFQYELYLPPQTEYELIRYFVNEVIDRFRDKYPKIEEAINYSVINETLFKRFVYNYRDAKALLNNYIMNIEFLTEEIDYIDLLHFTIMIKHYPKQVRYIYDNLDEIFGEKKYSNLDNINYNEEGLKSFLDLKDDNISDRFLILFSALFINVKEIHQQYCKKQYGNYRVIDDLMISNLNRTHIYFELIIRDNDISKKIFERELMSNGFINYVIRLLVFSKRNEDKKKEEVDNELKRNTRLLYTGDSINRIVVDNIIKYCNKYNKSIIDYLYSMVFEENIYRKSINFNVYKKNYQSLLWGNNTYFPEFIINSIIDIDIYVRNKKSAGFDSFVDDEILYLGYSKSEIKSLLIKKSKEYIYSMSYNERNLILISKILDSGLVNDEDIGLSSLLFEDRDKLQSYISAIERLYREDMKFESAIFKVFTDKEKLKNTDGNFLIDSLTIREFYHLLQLKELREDRVGGFIPFYFTGGDIQTGNLDKNYIYVKLKNEFDIDKNIDIEGRVGNNFVIRELNESYILFEGQLKISQFLEYMLNMGGVNNTNKSNMGLFLKDNEDKFEIFYIQSKEQIPDNIKKHITYYKELKQYEYVQ